MSDKARDSQPKLSTTLKFPLADKAWDSQPKLSPTPKYPLDKKEQDSHPKLGPTLWLTKQGILNQNLAQLKNLKRKLRSTQKFLQNLVQLPNFMWQTKRVIFNQNLVQLPVADKAYFGQFVLFENTMVNII